MEVTAEATGSRQQAADREKSRLVVPREADGRRLDLFVLEQAPIGSTRADVQRAIRAGAVHIAGKTVVKPGTIVRGGQELTVERATFSVQRTDTTRPDARGPMPELRILHEDPQLLVIDKPAGVPVHEGVKREPSLADALVERYQALRGIGEAPRWAGVVHRLDKETSGVLLVARTQAMYEHLKRQFQQRRVRKEYVALVHGVVSEEEGTVKLPIVRSKRNPLRRTIARAGEGKDAETAFRVLERFREHTLLAVFPRTGRMHQIRVHLAHLGFPVAGDTLYGRKSKHRTPPGLARQFLHARALTIQLLAGTARTFEGPLPEGLSAVLDRMRENNAPAAARPVAYRWRAPRGPRRGGPHA